MPSYSQEMELISRQLGQAHRAAIQAQLQAAGLGEVGHPLLMSVLQCSGEDSGQECQAQQDLAQMLHISPAAVANSLKSLERAGYIRRRPGPKDARRNQVILTQKGASAVAECQEIFQKISLKMLRNFSDEEQRQLESFQRRMLENLLEKED